MSKPCLRPEGDERWIYIAHRHWIALVFRAAIPFLLGLLAGTLLLWRLFERQPDFLGRTPPLLDAINALLVITGLVVAAALLYIYIDWRNDHLIVSNKRLLLEDQTLLLAFTYETIPLDRIQNVNVRVENFLQYSLKYGRVEIQAAGPTAPIVFDRAERPTRIQTEVMKEVNREKREQEQRRLQAAVQRRLNPAAPPAPAQVVPVEQGLRTVQTRLQSLIPLGPVLQGSTITWHRHWVVLIGNLAGPAVALIAWFFALFALPRLDLLDPAAITLVLLVALIAITITFFWQFDNWRNDVYILEPTRLIDLARLPFGLFEDRNEAPLGVIQNVNATAPNLIARIFGYGDVLVETAGQSGNLTFYNVPDPDQVQRIIFEYVERFKWQMREREWNNAINIVELYDQARHSGTNRP